MKEGIPNAVGSKTLHSIKKKRSTRIKVFSILWLITKYLHLHRYCNQHTERNEIQNESLILNTVYFFSFSFGCHEIFIKVNVYPVRVYYSSAQAFVCEYNKIVTSHLVFRAFFPLSPTRTFSTHRTFYLRENRIPLKI